MDALEQLEAWRKDGWFVAVDSRMVQGWIVRLSRFNPDHLVLEREGDSIPEAIVLMQERVAKAAALLEA